MPEEQRTGMRQLRVRHRDLTAWSDAGVAGAPSGIMTPLQPSIHPCVRPIVAALHQCLPGR